VVQLIPSRAIPSRMSLPAPASAGPIGVFDSGIGGLTVVAALRELLPAEDIFYLGDTARVPYGGKGRQTIERYTLEIAGLLLAEGAKAIVVACNTATALAIPKLQEVVPVPSVGVIMPGAAAAAATTRNGRVGVIGTRATIASGAYERALHDCRPDLEVHVLACPLLVPLVEEGWLEDPVTDQVVGRYLTPLLAAGIDTLVLGCTHYPFVRESIARFLGPGITIVDSARNCALATRAMLAAHGLAAPTDHRGTLQVALTDPSGAFLEVAERRLGLGIKDVQVRSVTVVKA
jgi:glutamate racemase